MKKMVLAGILLLWSGLAMAQNTIDTNSVTDQQTAKMLLKLENRMVKGGNAIRYSGTLLFSGILVTSAGGYLASTNKDAGLGIITMSVGTVLNILGLMNLSQGGNILRGAKGQDLRIELHGTSAGLTFRF